MEYLNEFLKEINTSIGDTLPYPKVKYYNEAHLQEKNGQTNPVVNLGDGRGMVISPDTKEGLITYHRVVGSQTDSDPERGHGKYPYRIKIYTIRSVWIGSRRYMPKKPFEFNEGILNEVIKSFPSVLTGKQIIRIIDINSDKITVLEDEFPGNNMQPLSLDLFAFYIEYELRSRLKC